MLGPVSFGRSRDRRLEKVFGGRFRFDGVISRTGNATIYRVFNRRLGRAEALKVLADRLVADSDFSARFVQEARVAAALEHPNIVEIYDFGEHDGIVWYTMRLVDGPDLATVLKARGPLDEATAAYLAFVILDALAFSHERGVIHRDIKPSNFLLDSAGRPCLADFGIAKAEASLRHTQTGVILGTPAYVAPEQVQGQPVDGRTDLYSLGITLYELLAGVYPFAGADPLQAVIQRLSGAAQPLEEKRPGVDPRFAAIVMRALEREPADRFASAREMRDAVAELLRGAADRSAEALAAVAAAAPLPETIEALRGHGVARRSVRSRSSRVWRWSAAAVAAAAVAFGVVLSVRRTEPPAVPTSGESAAVTAGDGVVTANRQQSGVPSPGPVSPTPAADLTATTAPSPTDPAVAPSPTPPGAKPRRTPLEPAAGRPVARPRLLERVDPELPPELASACAGEVVSLSLVIDEHGSVTSVKILSEARDECAEVAREAVRRYRYQPALDRLGRPVEAAVAVAVQF